MKASREEQKGKKKKKKIKKEVAANQPHEC